MQNLVVFVVVMQTWQWTPDSNGDIIGQYRSNRGSLESNEINISGGRFPHNHLQDMVVCNGQVFSKWQKPGWITVYPDDTTRLNPGLRNYVLPDTHPNQFICVEHNISLIGAAISPGSYFKGRKLWIWRFSGTSWFEIKSLRTYTRRREQRLCLRESGGDYVRLVHIGTPERIESCSEYLFPQDEEHL